MTEEHTRQRRINEKKIPYGLIAFHYRTRKILYPTEAQLLTVSEYRPAQAGCPETESIGGIDIIIFVYANYCELSVGADVDALLEDWELPAEDRSWFHDTRAKLSVRDSGESVLSRSENFTALNG